MQIQFAETGDTGGVLSLTASRTYAEPSQNAAGRQHVLCTLAQSDSLATDPFKLEN